MEIIGVTHPIPTEIAERIYNENKNIFIGKRCLCKVSKGDKFVLYESHGAQAYTGWADIKFIGYKDVDEISKNYSENLMINNNELKEYAKRRKKMLIIEFENFKKFKTPVKPNRFVSISGKYIYDDEFKMIEKNKD